MALSSTTEWEVRTDGNDLNGGGFNPARSGATKTSTDNYTYGPSYAVYSGINLTVDSVTNTYVQPDGYTPVTADIGHVIQISGGAGWTTGFYEITGITGSRWILDRSPAAAGTAGGVWRLGGALATPGMAGAAHIGGNVIWIRNGTYSVTSQSANVPNGRLMLAAVPKEWLTPTCVFGYENVRGDWGAPPTLSVDFVASTPVSIVYGATRSRTVAGNLRVVNTVPQASWRIYGVRDLNVAIGCSSLGSPQGIAVGFHDITVAYSCVAFNAQRGYGNGIGGAYIGCIASDCSVGFSGHNAGTQNRHVGCVAVRCTTGYETHVDNNGATVYTACHAVRCTDGFRYVDKNTNNDWADQSLALGCTASHCTYAVKNEGTLGGSTIILGLRVFNCTNLLFNGSANLPFVLTTETLQSDPFPGVTSTTTYLTDDYTHGLNLRMVGGPQWINRINDTLRFAVLASTATQQQTARPLNLSGGFNL